LEGALAEYSRCWLPNAHAVADLTEDAFGGNAREFTLNLKLVQVCVCVWGGGGAGAGKGGEGGWSGYGCFPQLGNRCCSAEAAQH
jgi:hypothetical protein